MQYVCPVSLVHSSTAGAGGGGLLMGGGGGGELCPAEDRSRFGTVVNFPAVQRQGRRRLGWGQRSTCTGGAKGVKCSHRGGRAWLALCADHMEASVARPVQHLQPLGTGRHGSRARHAAAAGCFSAPAVQIALACMWQRGRPSVALLATECWHRRSAARWHCGIGKPKPAPAPNRGLASPAHWVCTAPRRCPWAPWAVSP